MKHSDLKRHLMLFIIFFAVNFFLCDLRSIRYWSCDRPTPDEFGLPKGQVENLFLGGSNFHYGLSSNYISSFLNDMGCPDNLTLIWSYKSRGLGNRLAMFDDFLGTGRKCNRIFLSYYQLTERRHALFNNIVPFFSFLKWHLKSTIPSVFVSDFRAFFDRLPYIFLKLSKVSSYFPEKTQKKFKYFYNVPYGGKTQIEYFECKKHKHYAMWDVYKYLKKKYKFDYDKEKNWTVSDPYPRIYQKGRLQPAEFELEKALDIKPETRGELYLQHFLRRCIEYNVQPIFVEPVRYPNDSHVTPAVTKFSPYAIRVPAPSKDAEPFYRLKCYHDQGHLSRFGEKIYSHYMACVIGELNDIQMKNENRKSALMVKGESQ